MLAVLVVLGVVISVAVALIAVGKVVNRLGGEPARLVFEGDEALAFVVEALPDELTATLSYDDVARIMRLHLDFLHSRGVARSGGDLDMDGGVDVLEPEEGIDHVLRRGALVSFEPSRQAVTEVLGAQMAYFEAIGVISEVEGPDLAAVENELANRDPE